jgi:hypothetical protein
MSMDMERPLILYQVVEVETLSHAETEGLQNYVETRGVFTDEERAEQERKEIREAKTKTPDAPESPMLRQEAYTVTVRELKISPRTIQEADRMDEERHRTITDAARAAMSGEYTNQEEDNDE